MNQATKENVLVIDGGLDFGRNFIKLIQFINKGEIIDSVHALHIDILEIELVQIQITSILFFTGKQAIQFYISSVTVPSLQ